MYWWEVWIALSGSMLINLKHDVLCRHRIHGGLQLYKIFIYFSSLSTLRAHLWDPMLFSPGIKLSCNCFLAPGDEQRLCQSSEDNDQKRQGNADVYQTDTTHWRRLTFDSWKNVKKWERSGTNFAQTCVHQLPVHPTTLDLVPSSTEKNLVDVTPSDTLRNEAVLLKMCPRKFFDLHLVFWSTWILQVAESSFLLMVRRQKCSLSINKTQQVKYEYKQCKTLTFGHFDLSPSVAECCIPFPKSKREIPVL